MNEFNQLCVWPGTIVGPDEIENFVKMFKDDLDVRVKYAEETETNPTPGIVGTGGRNDLLFYIHDDDVMKFAIPKIKLGISWWEDVFFNNRQYLYKDEILNKYPKTW